MILVLLFSSSKAVSAQLENEVEVDIDSLFSSTNYYDINKAMQAKDKVYYLDLSMQKLEELPTNINTLKNIESLDLSFNRFKSLPNSITDLANLKILKVTGCYDLETLPTGFSKLKNLEELRIEDMMALPNTEIQRVLKEVPWAKVYFDTPK